MLLIGGDADRSILLMLPEPVSVCRFSVVPIAFFVGFSTSQRGDHVHIQRCLAIDLDKLIMSVVSPDLSKQCRTFCRFDSQLRSLWVWSRSWVVNLTIHTLLLFMGFCNFG
jgi:hypothetical protein